MYKKGFTPYLTIKTGVPIEYIIQSTYSVQDWKSDGYSLSFLKKNGFPIKKFREGKVSAKELRDLGVNLDDLIRGGYTFEELISAGYSDTELISKGCVMNRTNSTTIIVGEPIVTEGPTLSDIESELYRTIFTKKNTWRITRAQRE